MTVQRDFKEGETVRLGRGGLPRRDCLKGKIVAVRQPGVYSVRFSDGYTNLYTADELVAVDDKK